jgi:nicotinate-nucleotide adenylyltransferase
LSKDAVKRGRAVAIFGGTFDPIHCGHLIVAGAAARRFHLDEIYFVPSSRPPHKKRQELAAFSHRYAMVALACAGKARFVPSLAEAPDDAATPHVFYSIDTVRRFREQHAHDEIYFILGADSFLEIPIWWSYEALLDSCDFIIASRPGIRLEALKRVIPAHLLGHPNARTRNAIALRKSTVHLLTSVASDVSSTEIRRRCKRGASIHALVPPAVEDYIHRQALYR